MRCYFCKELNELNQANNENCIFCLAPLHKKDLFNLLPEEPTLSYEFIYDANFYEISVLQPTQIYKLLRDLIEQINFIYTKSNYKNWTEREKLDGQKRLIFYRKRKNLFEAIYFFKVGALPREGNRGIKNNQNLIAELDNSLLYEKNIKQLIQCENAL